MRSPRYRFGEFVISPARRQLLRGGREVPLIPRYLDLLLLLVERRDEAVHRRDILESVWSDVVVSDGALSQAIRILRRTLGDDPFSEPIAVLTDPSSVKGVKGEDAHREAAETLHRLGTVDALRRIGRCPGHERARAWLRDTRWDVPEAGPVPLLGAPGGGAAGPRSA